MIRHAKAKRFMRHIITTREPLSLVLKLPVFGARTALSARIVARPAYKLPALRPIDPPFSLFSLGCVIRSLVYVSYATHRHIHRSYGCFYYRGEGVHETR